MYTLKAENQYEDVLELTNNPAYSIIEIDGLDPPDSVINTTRNAGYDGSVFNSSYMDNRVITITLAINSPAETNRIALYQYFKSKFWIRLHYKNDSRDVYIDGYVRSFQIAFFAMKQTAQIVIECPHPNFNGSAESVQDFSSVTSLFEFPFDIEEAGEAFSELSLIVEGSIINEGDIITGAVITINALGTVDTPKIYDLATNDYLIINRTLYEGDQITIDTRQGNKSIILLSGGVETNIIGDLEQGSTWLQFSPGDNLLSTAADASPENMKVTFTLINQYEGV